MNRRLVQLMFAAGLAFACPRAYAQGGPPLMTDDPGTPGPGRWEINIAVTAERHAASWLLESPALDLNYGWGGRIQLNVELPWIIERDDGLGTQSGLGNARPGVKWRFKGSDTSGVAFSTYPHLSFNSSNSAARRGLVDRGTQLLLPLEVAGSVGKIKINGEVGLTLESQTPDQWVYGLALEHDPMEGLELLGEVHAVSATTGGATELVWDLGARKTITRQSNLLLTVGRSLPGSTDGIPRFFGYLGIQLLR